MSKPFVAILMGSDSDLPVMQETINVLREFGVSFEAKITSAHRTPAATHEYVKSADARGCAVFIAAAGMAAHLAGVVAALTVKPVVGVPICASLNGLDSLLSISQMPGGIPVACMAIGKAGAKNAAYFALQVLSLSDATLAQKLQLDRQNNAKKIAEKDAQLQVQLKE